MKAKSIKGKSPEEIKLALDLNMADGFKPTLAIVFLSMQQDRDAVTTLMDKQGMVVFGATTHGEFIDEDLGRGSISILLLDINPDYFSVIFAAYPEKNYREVAGEIARKAQHLFPHPAFLLSGSHMETDAELARATKGNLEMHNCTTCCVALKETGIYPVA